MSRTSVAFPRSYQRHLVAEQRKAVLAALRERIGPEHTVGEVLDAAEALGWSEPMGELSLADLAEALLAPLGDAASPADTEAREGAPTDEDQNEHEGEDEDEAPVKRGRGGKKTAAAKAKKTPAKAKKAGAKKAGSKKATASPTPNKKGAAKKAGKKAAKAAPVTTARGKKPAGAVSKKTGRSKRASKVDFDEPMSLEEAAGVLVPLVKSLGEATMQDLEEQTAGGRRKLRFHIGQLVRHGYLERHGMGRGTYYTAR